MFYTLLIVVFVPSIQNYVQMTQIHDIPSLTLVADLIWKDYHFIHSIYMYIYAVERSCPTTFHNPNCIDFTELNSVFFFFMRNVKVIIYLALDCCTIWWELGIKLNYIFWCYECHVFM